MTAVAWTPPEVSAYWRSAYPELRQRGAEWRGKCPLHNGRRDSFAVNSETGAWCCHSECGRGGSLIDFETKRTGCSFSEALKVAQQIVGRPVSGNGSRRIIATYSYRDECGNLLFEVCRYHPKSFSQRRPVGNGGWVWNLDGVERVLYNLPVVLKAGEVIVVEGAKDAGLLTGWGLTATTAPGGAGKWRQEYAAALRGRGVTILPDADRPGREHALKVAASLLGVADGVKIIELPGAKDVAEWAEKGGTKEVLMRLAGESAALTRESLEALRRRWSPDDSQAAESKTPEQQAREAMFDSLATLSDIDYERRRRDVAAEFGIRVGALDAEVKRRRSGTNACGDGPSGTLLEFPDPEPWPEPVDGAQVLDRIAEAVTRHVVLSPHCVNAVALWIMFAHCHDRAEISPILAITSPVHSCGKTTLLTLISALTPHPLPTSNITPAALFRSVEKYEPTLLIDEADSFLSGNEDLRGILDSGHSRAMGFVVRTVGEDLEPRKFSTWCPKVIAAIGRLAPTLVSRSIRIKMQRKRADDKVVPLRADRLGHLTPLTRQAWRWHLDNSQKLSDDPKLPESLHGRAADNWRYLAAIADAAGGRWPQAARQAAVALEVGDDSEAAGVQLLEDISGLFSERETDRLSSSEIVAALTRMEDRPWPEWRKDKPISTRQVARLLKGFDIQPRTIRSEGAGTARGYYQADFTDALVRYSPSRSNTPTQTNGHGGYSDFRSDTSNPGVSDRKPPKANRDGGCVAVLDRNPQKPDEARRKVEL